MYTPVSSLPLLMEFQLVSWQWRYLHCILWKKRSQLVLKSFVEYIVYDIVICVADVAFIAASEEVLIS